MPGEMKIEDTEKNRRFSCFDCNYSTDIQQDLIKHRLSHRISHIGGNKDVLEAHILANHFAAECFECVSVTKDSAENVSVNDIDIVEHKIEVMDSDGQQDVIDFQDKDDIHHGNTNISEDPLMLEPGESSQFVDCGESIKQEIKEELYDDSSNDPLCLS